MRWVRSTTLTLLLAVVATTAAARDDDSRRVRIRWEAYRIAAEYVDPRDAPAPVNAMSVVLLDRVPAPTVSVRGSLERELAEDRLLVEARDPDGRVRFQSVIPDPRVLRAEPGGPEGRLSGRLLYRSHVEFDVIVPDDPAIAELRFYDLRWTGDGWQRVPLGNGLSLVALGGGPPPPPPDVRTSWPVTTIVDNGDPAHRLDLVILGDGYTSGQLKNYGTDVDKLVKALFAEWPFSEYRRYFNVHRVDVASPQSGADHPSLALSVNTALDASYDCRNIERLICVKQAAVNATVSGSLPQTPADLVLVLVNDPQYGGSGGAIAVASTHPKAVELVLHEEGHSFGSLADEYGGPPPPACVDNIEPPEPNATRQSRGAGAKWSRWIDEAGARAECSERGEPTMCKGARYCDSTLFRPTLQSKMRELGFPFQAINGEQLVKRIYSRISPIDGVSPAATTLALKPGAQQVFTVETPRPSTHALRIVWKLNGADRSTTAQFTFLAPSAPGRHTVTVSVEDPTDMVRNDPDGLLKASHSWEVTVGATPP